MFFQQSYMAIGQGCAAGGHGITDPCAVKGQMIKVTFHHNY